LRFWSFLHLKYGYKAGSGAEFEALPEKSAPVSGRIIRKN